MLEQLFIGNYKNLLVIRRKESLLKHDSNIIYPIIIKIFVFLSEEFIHIVLF